ncbi:MAG TPA: metallophosphoesterase [Gemmataceae bacterium]|nr:metallophosphoesterase [Gemmataceae bacterium]
MSSATYLVFGDLHGRILPAFRLALAWGREHDERLDGLLQVGDLGFFPDPSRMDKATLRHAADDPLERGTELVTVFNKQADALFAEPDLPAALWFTVGNHEDYDALEQSEHGALAADTDFPVDAYGRVRCLRDGRVTALAGGLRVGALWGIDDRAPNARRKTPLRGRIRPRGATQLAGEKFDVLLTHESPRDAMFLDSGSEEIDAVLGLAHPAFQFFGHYKGTGRRVPEDHGGTQVYHLSGLELRGYGGTAEEGSVGVLRWRDGAGTFEYVAPAWLRTFTRHNWMHR